MRLRPILIALVVASLSLPAFAAPPREPSPAPRERSPIMKIIKKLIQPLGEDPFILPPRP